MAGGVVIRVPTYTAFNKIDHDLIHLTDDILEENRLLRISSQNSLYTVFYIFAQIDSSAGLRLDNSCWSYHFDLSRLLDHISTTSTSFTVWIRPKLL